MIPRSFCTERTVEYFLVPHVRTILTSCFDRITPMHFSSTREGNKTSLLANCEASGRLLVIFPRRPKVSSNNNSITFKINKELLLFAEEANKFGIPVLAGYPLAINIIDLNAATFEFSIVNRKIVEEQSFTLERKNDMWKKDSVPTPINSSQISDLVYASSPELTWEAVVDTLKKLKINLRYSESWSYFRFNYGRYSPLFFLLGSNSV